MAIAYNNLLLQSVRGTIGKQLTIYERNGQIIVAKKRSKSNTKPTPQQLAARARMARAVAYAKQMLRDPDIKAAYAAKAGPGQNAYNMAVRDAYHAPEIQDVHVEKNTVVIRAKNEFRLKRVDVQVVSADGEIVTSGKAELSRNGVDWYYTLNLLPAGGRIIITARDLPGNETVRELKIDW
jgi:hypothetical protein